MDEMEVFAATLDALKDVKAKETVRDEAAKALSDAQAAYAAAVQALQAYRDQVNDLFGGATSVRVRQG